MSYGTGNIVDDGAIAAFLAKHGIDFHRLQGRSLQDAGLRGEDLQECIEDLHREFDVDVAAYRWYWHTGPEGENVLWAFARPWWSRLQRIPITVDDLRRSVAAGKWAIEYPPTPLGRRVDYATWIMLVIVVAILICVLI